MKPIVSSEKVNLQAEFDAVSDNPSDSQNSGRLSDPAKRFKDPNEQWLTEVSPPAQSQVAPSGVNQVYQRGHPLVAPIPILPHGQNVIDGLTGRETLQAEEENSSLAQQIAELNRQHAEAQSKLQSLLEHQHTRVPQKVSKLPTYILI